jgi:RNA polymerase sigma-70 factor (ECF subfamily)
MSLHGDHQATGNHFATTQWSLIAAARGDNRVEADAALGELCRVYWYPVYAFFRHKGVTWDQAQDLTQEFFTRLVEKDLLGFADQSRGRFRSFLRTACSHFLANERERATAEKRGGGRVFHSIDGDQAERRYQNEPAHDLTAERLFERRWATTVLERALAQLKGEYQESGRAPAFDLLKSTLVGDGSARRPYDALGDALGISEGAARVAAHRLRQRYRELLHAEIARTVDDPSAVDDEVRRLFQAFAD